MATAAPRQDVVEVQEVQEVVAPVVVAPTHRSVRVKGTWTMYFGAQRYDFVDGQRYELPTDLFLYLKERGNIYDTLA